MSVDHQSVQEPISHRLVKGYSPEGCWSSLFFLFFSFFFPFISAPFSGVCFNMEHGMLFDKLLTRGLPVSIVRFLSSWYYAQQMCVRWNSSVSDSFHVSNGVRQGGVLSRMLFAVYVDSLLEMLVGCFCFVGAVCYADDIILLVPCASALRVLLDICDTFASSHGLVFNAAKTQLICFRQRYTNTFPPEIIFNGLTLRFVEEVSHLGHILAYNLDDKQDINRAIKELNRKANSANSLHLTLLSNAS